MRADGHTEMESKAFGTFEFYRLLILVVDKPQRSGSRLPHNIIIVVKCNQFFLAKNHKISTHKMPTSTDLSKAPK